MEATVDFKDITHAWLRCRRNKRKSQQAQLYETALLDRLIDTVQGLQAGSWQPAPPVCFVVKGSKPREIHAAPFTDRVVHHWLVPLLEICYEPVFIHDLYSNRKGKGTLAAVNRLQVMMRSQYSGIRAKQATLSTQQYQGYFLQLDIHNFFNSINKPMLFSLLQQRLAKAVRHGQLSIGLATHVRQLCHIILKQDVAAEAINLNPHALATIPPHKRLGFVGSDTGIAIGNLTSQFFANVYLNELDQYVKHQLKCKHYVRYVDDFVLLHPCPQTLLQWRRQIEDYLRSHLQLRLKQRAEPQPVANGVNFLGYIIRPHYCLVRRRVVGHLRERLYQFQQQAVMGSLQNGWHIDLQAQNRDRLRSQLASYLGHFSHARHHRLISALQQRFPWLQLLFVIHNCRLQPRWFAPEATRYSQQLDFFRGQFPSAALRVQKGYQQQCFAPAQSDPACQHLLDHTVTRLRIEQQGWLKHGARQRCITEYWIQPGVNLCPV